MDSYYKKVSLFLYEQENKGKDIQDYNVCECGYKFEIIDLQILCTHCGVMNGYVDSMDSGSFKKYYPYNKVRYFAIFLQRIQGLGGFNKERYEQTLYRLFGKPPQKITLKKIREVLLKNNLSKQLLRYTPDIYYLLTDEQPTQLHQEITRNMIIKYKEIVMYAKKEKIKIPSSKQYFAQLFLRQLSTEHKLLFFISSNVSKVEKEKYNKCYNSIFKKSH